MERESIDVGDFGSIVAGNAAGTWMPAGFPTGNGEMWFYQEPNAVVVVQNGKLRVAAVPFTRQHDEVQILDNAKHMYFSTRTFAAPEGGRLTLEWNMAAQIVGGRDGDLYDGFVSFHLLDLSRGVAVNYFVGNDVLATVYAHLPFPGAKAPRSPSGPRFFAWFEERSGDIAEGEPHDYSICYDAGQGEITWKLDGDVVKHVTEVEPIGPFHLAMGLMTEKDVQPGKGSVSCHGQGAVGTWGDIRATLEKP